MRSAGVPGRSHVGTHECWWSNSEPTATQRRCDDEAEEEAEGEEEKDKVEDKVWDKGNSLSRITLTARYLGS